MQSKFNLKKWQSNVPVLIIALTLMGCKSIPDPRSMPNGDYGGSFRHIPYAAATPIRDLNIGIKPIPRQLEVLQNPYGTDTHTSCEAILKETKDLEVSIDKNYRRLYGPNYNKKTRAGNLGEASSQVVRAASTSLLPYRGIIRYASGAYHRNKAGLEADRRGRERLGFLIATGQARSCPGFKPPAGSNR